MRLLLTLVGCVLAGSISEEEFNDEIKNGPVFAKFYAPWCGHCKKLAPTWSELAEEVNGDKEWGARIVSVDCTQYKVLCSQKSVAGYPTLKYFADAESNGVKYTGARTISDLRDWLNNQLPSADDNEVVDAPKQVEGQVASLTSKTYQESISPAEQISFVKFFAPWCGHCKNMAGAWIDLAKAYGSNDAVLIAEVDCTIEKSVCEQNEIRGFPTIKIFKGGEFVEAYKGGRDLGSLTNAVNRYVGQPKEAVNEKPVKQVNIVEQVFELTADNFASTISSGSWFVKFYAPWCGHCKTLAPVWEELADAKTNAKIAKVNCIEHNNICKENSVTGFPTLLFFQDGKNLGKHKGARDLKTLKTSIVKFINPDAAIAENEDDNAHLDKFYKKMDGKHALVKFYAPWCGHCKSLAPVWTLLEEKFESNGKTSVFDVDCTADAGKEICKQMKITGYPTIQYFAPGKIVGEKYSSGRHLDSLEKFLNAKMSDHDEL